MALTWHVDVDWNNDGTLEADEAARLLGVNLTRGREHLLNANGNGFEPARAGECTLLLDSYDRRFDPFYTSSALYPNVKPGRDVRVRVYDGTTTYTIFRGAIDSIEPQGTSRNVKIKIKDGWAWLANANVRYATQANVRTDTAIGYILTAANYPSVWSSSLQAGSDTIPYWWASDERADTALRDLADSEFGLFYVAADGKATFKNRASAYNATADVTLDQTTALQDFGAPRPWETLRNIVRVALAPQTNTVIGATLWKLNEKPLLKYNSTVTFWANLKYQTFPAILTGDASYAYSVSMNTNQDGTGTTIVPTVTLTPYGTMAKIVVSNLDGSAKDAYLTALLVTGDAIYVPDETTVEYDNSSGSEYGTRVFQLKLRWQQVTTRAVDFAKYIATFLGTSRLQPVLKMENRWSTQFAYDLGAVVSFTSAYWGVANLYRIIGIEHASGDTVQEMRTTWRLAPMDETVYWKIGTSKIGSETIVAY